MTPGTPYYITTPIYYVNDRPHIGHCYTTLVADVAARFARLLGRDVFFLTGTDEHAEKVVTAAAARGITPQAWADQNAAEFREAFRFMNIAFDDFVRTSEERHKSRASRYIQKLVDSGAIALGDYEGWWDASQEEYLTETVAKDNDFKSPVTKKPLEKRREQNYFFDLPAHAAWLEAEISADRIRVLPEARKNEVLGRIRQGLQRVPVSRRVKEGETPEAAAWGIRMPNDPQHRVYVWIEALCNYLTVVDTPDRRKWWPADVHLMAKDILWFHAVIWPAMLRAMGERPPRTVYAHAYFVAEGVKMSKSLGNFIEIDQLRAYGAKFGVDAVRWYLATQGPLGATDADFSHSRFVEVYNADLANGIGNCASRVGNMIEKYFEGKVPSPARRDDFPVRTQGQDGRAAVDESYDWKGHAGGAAREAAGAFEVVGLDAALRIGMGLVARVDRFINDTRPFSVAKDLDGSGAFSGLSNRDALASILYQCAEAIRIASLLLWPALPEKMEQLWRTWNCDPRHPDGSFKAPLEKLAQWGGEYSLKPGQLIAKGEALFMRADPKDPAPTAQK